MSLMTEGPGVPRGQLIKPLNPKADTSCHVKNVTGAKVMLGSIGRRNCLNFLGVALTRSVVELVAFDEEDVLARGAGTVLEEDGPTRAGWEAEGTTEEVIPELDVGAAIRLFFFLTTNVNPGGGEEGGEGR